MGGGAWLKSFVCVSRNEKRGGAWEGRTRTTRADTPGRVAARALAAPPSFAPPPNTHRRPSPAPAPAPGRRRGSWSGGTWGVVWVGEGWRRREKRVCVCFLFGLFYTKPTLSSLTNQLRVCDSPSPLPPITQAAAPTASCVPRSTAAAPPPTHAIANSSSAAATASGTSSWGQCPASNSFRVAPGTAATRAAARPRASFNGSSTPCRIAAGPPYPRTSSVSSAWGRGM